MNGQISEHPFIELLREISHSKLSGAVRLEQDRIRGVVYFENGDPVFAASNLKNLRLGEYLLKRNQVSPAQLSAVANNRSDTAIAKELSQQGIVDEDAISSAFSALVTDVLRVAILWSEGSWIYDSQTQLAEAVRVKVPIRNLLLEGARKMGLKFVASRLANPSEIIAPSAQNIEADRLSPDEGFVMSRVDRPLELKEVVALSGKRDLDAIRTVYGLVLADYLQREVWHTVLGSGSAKDKDEAARARPLQKTQAQKTEAEELAEFFERVEGASNYYEVLNVPQTCSVEDIKRSYYMLARGYHPDRFHSQDCYARIENAFASITQAYETLIDFAQRNTYDARLSAQERSQQAADSAPRGKTVKEEGEESSDALTPEKRAENSFREGYAALKLGQLGAAVPHLAAAAQAVPDEPRYRAYYGQALASQGTSQRLAEVELTTAVRLEPTNVAYRLMLANLYYRLKFFKRSLSEAERALAIDPENDKARELMKMIQEQEG